MADERAAEPLPSAEELVDIIATRLRGRELARDYIDELHRAVRRERIGGSRDRR